MSTTDDGSKSRNAAKEDSVKGESAVEQDTKHDTLKYHLLGPSLTKAGQDSVDQRKVSEIIYNASKGSKFFNNEEVRDRNLTERIANIIAKKARLAKLDLSSDMRRADDMIAQLEMSRDLSQHIVHIDCDAFYAAVEQLDRPELKDVPFAVGKGVLTTCNYHARKFGCRSGMAGFVAVKLCPHLIQLPLDFTKYTAKAVEVRAVLSKYDERFESASIDEAYMNITAYCEEHSIGPEEAVSQLRAEVEETTKITISAGIAPNAKLAKIASNVNKPNGQFRIQSDRAAVMAFMSDLPCRKVNGIGRVLERELAEIGVKTCGDIYSQRAFLTKLFGEKAARFLLQTHLGLGRTSVQPAEEYERKSVGTESTFGDMSDPTQLRDKLLHTAEELQGDLERTGFKGQTLCIKIKLHTYEVFTRQTAPPFAVWKKEDLFKYSLPMLVKLEKEFPAMKLRLMGLRVTHLVPMKRFDNDFFGRYKVPMPTTHDSELQSSVQQDNKADEWETWPEEEFEAAARLEEQERLEELQRLSQEYEEKNTIAQKKINDKHGRVLNEARKQSGPEESQKEHLICPICSTLQPAEDRLFNDHIDLCLSRQTIREAVKQSDNDPPSRHSSVPPMAPEHSNKKPVPTGVVQKRARSKKLDIEPEQRNNKKRAFFT